jgi:hypothetical protein
MTAAPVPHPVIPVLAERGGTQLQTPRPTLLVDSREQNPFNFSRFQGWFAGNVDPNRTTQSLIAALAGLQVPFLCSETHELGEELVASYLYQVHLYHWLESHDYGRFLSDNDL